MEGTCESAVRTHRRLNHGLGGWCQPPGFIISGRGVPALSVLSRVPLIAIVAVTPHVLTIAPTAVGDGVTYYLFLGHREKGIAIGIGYFEVLAATGLLVALAISLCDRHSQAVIQGGHAV